MRSLSCVAITVIGLGTLFSPAQAKELWTPYLRGVDEGLASGALPPAGVYGVLNNYWAGYDQYDSKGHKTGLKLDALIEVPVVLWVTGLKVLGADYAVALAQPFDYTNVKMAGASSLSNNAHWGNFNTILVPGQLSWSLPNDLHVKTGLSVYLDDASSSPAHPPSGGGVGAGNGHWSLQPDLGISWLHDDWNLSLEVHYDVNFEDGKTHYTSGDDISVDYTLAKTIGKWTVGLGAHQQNQITSDSGAGAAGCATKNGCKVNNYGMGPLVGYQFTDISIMAEYNHNLYAENDVAGEIFNVRLVTKF
ncbi:SphA family protein [Telmatospirillum siberiense]|uniref:Transporter n=1 Tax=Telmatospirillum siberiense TaxID=382514 RepID=A0A2N3PR40_9PROT|nr:transporter [Telmatospirillum siberiense]PKU22854.1 transporter [Telmatospirillum siberiense]